MARVKKSKRVEITFDEVTRNRKAPYTRVVVLAVKLRYVSRARVSLTLFVCLVCDLCNFDDDDEEFEEIKSILNYSSSSSKTNVFLAVFVAYHPSPSFPPSSYCRSPLVILSLFQLQLFLFFCFVYTFGKPKIQCFQFLTEID